MSLLGFMQIVSHSKTHDIDFACVYNDGFVGNLFNDVFEVRQFEYPLTFDRGGNPPIVRR